MRNGKRPHAEHSWQPAILLSGTFTTLLVVVAVRLQIMSSGSILLRIVLLAGIVLLALGLAPAAVSRVYRSLAFDASVQRLPAPLRRWTGLLFATLPAVFLLATMWVRNAPAAQVSTPPGHVSEYQIIAERAQLNAAYLPRLQYSMADEQRTRDNKAAMAEQDLPGTSEEQATLQADWPAYLQAVQQKALASYHLDAFGTNASLDVLVHDTLKMHYQTADYEIEVLTWQAAPGIYMPAVVYKPLGLSGPLPVVITPPACHEDVASDRPESSMQRRMANFALSGMIVFSTEGFCANGILKDVPGNQRRFDYYTLAGGAGVSNVSLELLVWLRALDYLATRPDTDMARVAITSYSNGATIAKSMMQVTNRIAAVAVVSSGLPETNDTDFFSAARDNNNVFDKPNTFYNGTHWDIPEDLPEETSDASAKVPFAPTWSSDQLQLALNYGAPRPVYFVLGSEDSHYSILDAERAVGEMQQPWKDLGASLLPTIDVVDAVHGYNAEHESLVRKWLINVLGATPVLPPPGGLEYETSILRRNQLEVRPAQFPGTTLHDLYSGLALKAISAVREQSPFAALSHDEGVARVRDLLGLTDQSSGSIPRPILLDDSSLPFHGRQVRFQYWLVGSDEYLRSGLLLLYEDEAPQSSRKDISLTISTDESLPSESDLQTAMKQGEIVAIVIAPGYGPLQSSQSTTGNLARHQAKRLTLVGMGTSIVERSVDLLRAQWPESTIKLNANGVDAGNIAYFATALDPRIDSAWVTQGMPDFDSILTAPTQPYVPPTLLVPGILAMSVGDLRRLASPREIHIVSKSDLSELHPTVP